MAVDVLNPLDPFGPNIAKEVCTTYVDYFEHSEKELHQKIDELDGINKRIRAMANVMNALTHEQRHHSRANFCSNGEIREGIDLLYDLNPKIFESGNSGEFDPNQRYIFEDEEAIKAVLQALDAEKTMQIAESQRILTHLTHKYDLRAQLTKQAHDVIKEACDHIKSLVNHQRAGGA